VVEATGCGVYFVLITTISGPVYSNVWRRTQLITCCCYRYVVLCILPFVWGVRRWDVPALPPTCCGPPTTPPCSVPLYVGILLLAVVVCCLLLQVLFGTVIPTPTFCDTAFHHHALWVLCGVPVTGLSVRRTVGSWMSTVVCPTTLTTDHRTTTTTTWPAYYICAVPIHVYSTTVLP